jgi:hypothetical protein
MPAINLNEAKANPRRSSNRCRSEKSPHGFGNPRGLRRVRIDAQLSQSLGQSFGALLGGFDRGGQQARRPG